MFYFLPAAGAGKTDASTGKNRLPEDSTHVPVLAAGTGCRYRKPVSVYSALHRPMLK